MQRHHIPDEVFQYIFSFASLPVQHKSIALTCKRFFAMVQQEHAWQLLLSSYYPLHFQYLQEQVNDSTTLSYKQEFAKVHRFCFDSTLIRKRDLKLKKRNKVVVGKSMLLAEKYRLVVSEEGFTSGRHYFEIKIEEIGDAFSPGIGLCRMPSKHAARKGDLSVMGWSWFPALQSKYNQGLTYAPVMYDRPLCKHDTVQILFDMEQNMIQFAHNGEDAQVGFFGQTEFGEMRQAHFVHERNVQSVHLAVSLNGSCNKVRIISHQCVPKSMTFEQVLNFATKMATPTRKNSCIIA